MKNKAITNEIIEWLIERGWNERPERKGDDTSVTSFRYRAGGEYGLDCSLQADERDGMLTLVACADYTVPKDKSEDIVAFCEHFRKDHGNIYLTASLALAYIHSRSIESFANGVSDVKKNLSEIVHEMDEYISSLAPYIVEIVDDDLSVDDAIRNLEAQKLLREKMNHINKKMKAMDNHKQTQIAALAEQRRLDDQKGLSKTYKKVGEFHGGVYDTWGFVSPWTRSACNYDSRIMIVAQDWISEDAIQKTSEASELGYDPSLPTNKNLQTLLAEHFGLDFSEVYATNLFVFVKPGGMSTKIPLADLVYSAKTYTLKEIDIVGPRAVICLGSSTFNALCIAMGAEPPAFKESISNPVCYGDSLIFGVPHTGGLGVANAGGFQSVKEVWKNLVSRLASDSLGGRSDNQFDGGVRMARVTGESGQVKNENLPDVIPYFQGEQKEDGEFVKKRFKPLSYALLCWLKMKGEKDSIDISDDENSSQYEFSMDSLDQSFRFKCYFNTYEETGLITYCMYFLESPFNTAILGDGIYKFIADINLQLPVGQFQLVGEGDERTLRYYSAVNLQGIASADPEYEGPFQIHPLTYERLFVEGANAMNLNIDAFTNLISAD